MTKTRLFLLVAVLTVASSVTLSASLHYPEVLLDDRSFAASLIAARPVAVAAGLLASLGAGAALIVLSRSLGGRAVVPLGWAAASCAAAGFAGPAGGARLAFVAAEVAGPLLLAAWTVLVIRRTPGARVLGALGVAGLLATAARSTVWLINTTQPVDSGFYLTSALATDLALLGRPVWVAWLVGAGLVWTGLVGTGLVGSGLVGAGRRPRLAAGLLVPVFAIAYAVIMIVSTPTPDSAAVPRVPSAAAAVRYTVGLALRDRFALPADRAGLLAARGQDDITRPVAPPGSTLSTVDADGVPAEYLCATGASPDRVVVYFPGGGFIMPPGAGARRLAANVSRESGACVLLVRYRLAPEHPFPAGLQDCVRAYRWLRAQGVPAGRIALIGDSAGGNLVLATALSLKRAGEAQPAALVDISGITDFTRGGATWRTKAGAEILIRGGTVPLTLDGYTGGTADRRDPLMSPLFADVTGLAPTMLMVGSQEVLLSDVTRMADRMRAASVEVRLEVWPGMPHSFESARKETMETRLAVRHIASFVSGRMPARPATVG